MQYLYDDVVPPFRFFAKIVMRCVNNALDEATKNHRTEHASLHVPYTSIAADNPCLVEVPPGLVARSVAVGPTLDSAAGRMNASAGNSLSAVCVVGDVVLCGFTNGRVTLVYSSPHGGAFETLEIPPFTPNPTQVVALSCVPLREGHWVVAVSHEASVFVRTLALKQSVHPPMVLRKRTQQRVIEMRTTEWASGARVSSLQLSPCVKYLAVAFSDDALVAVAALPSLGVSRHGLGDGPERVTLDLTSRLVEDGRLGGNRQARVFFMPERLPGGLRSAFLSASTWTDPETTAGAHHPLCLLVWVNGNSYTRCPLKSISGSALRRLSTVLASGPPVTVSCSKKSILAATAAEAAATSSAAHRTRLKSKLGAGGLKEGLADAASEAATSLLRQSPFIGMYRGLLSDRIVAAALASADGTVVAVGCAGGCVYLMDGHGITSMLFATPFQGKSMRLMSLHPSKELRCGMVLRAVRAPPGEGRGVTLAHARGSVSPAFLSVGTVRCLRDVEGLTAVLPLGELPLVVLFCAHGVYLWDVHYNCVVASLAGLPPLEPFSLCEVLYRGAASGALRPTLAKKLRSTLYLPFCTETAIVWWTSDETLARLSIADLLAQVYPLLDAEFRGLPMRAMAHLLARVPPAQRHVPECVANFELPAECQLLLDTYDVASPAAAVAAAVGGVFGGGTGAGLADLKDPAREAALHRFPELPFAPLHPETIASCFLETTCSSVTTRAEELSAMFGASLPRGS
ncbi:uncharacterized protein Tco025E_01575 [Trypanosoma conorhini]|uniref:Uncharacterized protein n=1 Tax=Trypanosoma conorhini TaxID=83891 RepID=A0A3R7PWC3_9TRYP|nr:uncharacterized protein Tco025E_01575 [Trypanosoma conorhini]RNF26175.1 hypothetical protein Tco025E_01575 [Trypanosoma conorhini]